MDKTPINLGRIFVFLFVVLFIRAGLTKAGLIPNRFDVGYLHSDKKISLRLPFEIQSNRDSDVLNLHVNLRSPFEIQYFYDNESDWILEHRVVDPDSHVNHRPFYFPDTISTDIDKENNMVTGSVDEVIRLNSEDGFFIIDVNDSNYPQGCKTPGLLNPEKCILRTSNNYCIAPYQTESTQTRYEANSYCNSLNILGLSRELPYAYSHENNIYWNNLINIKSKIYGFNAYGSEKTGHYRAYPVNPTFENCSTLNGNCGNEYGSYKLSVRCVAPCGKMPSEVKNVNNDDLLKNNGLNNEKQYRNNFNDNDLFKAVESMGLTFSNCPNIFFQPVKDDESMAKYYWNEDHDYYYWDKENKKMILMPNISYVGSSDCESYDKWFEEDEFKTEMEDLDIKIIERQTCDEYSPHRNICSSKVKCKKVFDMGDFIKYKCCNQESECIFRESYTVHIPDCSKGPC